MFVVTAHDARHRRARFFSLTGAHIVIICMHLSPQNLLVWMTLSFPLI